MNSALAVPQAVAADQRQHFLLGLDSERECNYYHFPLSYVLVLLLFGIDSVRSTSLSIERERENVVVTLSSACVHVVDESYPY